MNLTGSQIKDTYEGVLNIGATGLTGALQEITDGLGNLLNIQVSDTTVNFSGIVTGNIIGTTGAAGTSGTSGTSGADGSSGSSGTSGAAGSSGSSGTSGADGSSGSSGTSGNSGSSGSSGTSGNSGSSGSSGTSGAAGAAGATGSTGASGPESLTYDATLKTYYTCTASPSSTCANSCNVIIGDGSMITSGPAAGRCNVVAIGNCITSQFDSGVSSNPIVIIGRCLSANDCSINIGFCQTVQSGLGIGFCNTGGNFGHFIGSSNNSNGSFVLGNSNSANFAAVVVGCSNNIDGGYATAIGKSNCMTNGACGFAAGFCNTTDGGPSVALGSCNRIFPGATGTIVLGNSSIGGTGACNSVVIGNSSCVTSAGSVVIGNSLISRGTDRTHMRQPNVQSVPGPYNTDPMYYAGVTGGTAGDFYMIDTSLGLYVLTVAGFNP